MPLGRLYGDELLRWLESHHVELQFQHGVKNINLQEKHVTSLRMRSDETRTADWYVSSAPFDRLLDLLPTDAIDGEPYFANLRHLETSPITSVHCWFDRAATDLPHIVLLDRPAMVIHRGDFAGEWYS